jgi:tetratricopeptide (TPR) repeat protein
MKRSFPVTGFCLVLLVFFYLSSPAETKDQAYKDSLEKALAAGPADSIRLKLLWNLDKAYISMSRAAIYKGDMTQAKDWLKKGYALAEKRKDSLNMGMALLNLGAVSQDVSDYTGALDYYIRSVHIARAIRDTPLTNLNNLNIASLGC